MEQKAEKIIIEGTIVSARYGANKFDDTNKYRISIKSDSIPYDDIHAYDEVGPKMTPSWYKNRDGYINLASIYEIPIKDYNGKVISFDDWLEKYNALGSVVLTLSGKGNTKNINDDDDDDDDDEKIIKKDQ